MLSLLAAGFVATASAAKLEYPYLDAVGYTYGQSYFTTPQGYYPSPSNLYTSGPYSQVVTLLFDGLHQFDLVRYVDLNPDSTFAKLVGNAIVYSNARAAASTDSMPATASIFTGGTPKAHGMNFETMWDRSLYTGGTNCTGPPGGLVDYSEACDLNSTAPDGGNGFNLTYLPYQLSSWNSCEPVYPHDYLLVNTVFEVGRGNAVYTAYADKHLSYELVNGPSGTGLSEGYFPEIHAVPSSKVQSWDDLHWNALANWTAGNYVNGTKNPDGGPRLYGANFQAITVAQQKGGYLDGAGTPNASLALALKTADQRLGTYLGQLKDAGKLDSTLLIISAKQGQGPIDPKTENILDPALVTNVISVPVALFSAEDGGVLWLVNPDDAPTAKAELLANATALGIEFVLAGDEVEAAGFGNPRLDARAPDLVIGSTTTTLWNTPFEFEDHAGFLPADLDVPLLAYNPGIKARNITQQVSTRQIASTMLQALGISPSQLQAYNLGLCPVLPGIFNQGPAAGYQAYGEKQGEY